MYLFPLKRRKEGEEGKPEQDKRLQDFYKQNAGQSISAPCSLLQYSLPLDLQQSMLHIETVFRSGYPGRLSSKFGSTEARVQIKYRKGNQQITEKSQSKVILSV